VKPIRQHDYQLNVLVYGYSFARKSSTTARTANDVFPEQYTASIGVGFRIKRVFFEDKIVKLLLWDTIGFEMHCMLRPHSLKGMHALIIMYDITNQSSFDFAKEWINQPRKNTCDSLPAFLVGNKIDLEEKRVIEQTQGLELSKEFDAEFYEMSAKTAAGLRKIMRDLVNKMIKVAKKKKEDEKTEKLRLTQDQSEKTKCY